MEITIIRTRKEELDNQTEVENMCIRCGCEEGTEETYTDESEEEDLIPA